VIQITLSGKLFDPIKFHRFGFIEFSNEEEAKNALQQSGYELLGKKIKISISKSNISSKCNKERLEEIINYCKVKIKKN
jgi:RNA recognition motif-containing protein